MLQERKSIKLIGLWLNGGSIEWKKERPRSKVAGRPKSPTYVGMDNMTTNQVCS